MDPIRKRAMLRASQGATAKLNISWLDMTLLRLRLARVVAETQHVKSYQVHVLSLVLTWAGTWFVSGCQCRKYCLASRESINAELWTNYRMNAQKMERHHGKTLAAFLQWQIHGVPQFNRYSVSNNQHYIVPNIKYLHYMRRRHVPLHWFTLCRNPLCFQEVIDWNGTWRLMFFSCSFPASKRLPFSSLAFRGEGVQLTSLAQNSQKWRAMPATVR